jgi:ABC-2 type transport system ATP-binding protein
MDAINCRGLTKRYRGRAVVDRLELSVKRGDVLGLLGPADAGKTTTLRLLLGLVRPDAGRAMLFGEPVPCPRLLARVGSLVGEPAFYPWLTGRENLAVLLASGPPASARAVKAALERAGLGRVADHKIKAYPPAQRQRLGLAAALLRRPRLLLLDDPLACLAHDGAEHVRDLVGELRQDGVTMLLAGRRLGELEPLCSRLAFMKAGRLLAGASASEGEDEAVPEVPARPGTVGIEVEHAAARG